MPNNPPDKIVSVAETGVRRFQLPQRFVYQPLGEGEKFVGVLGQIRGTFYFFRGTFYPNPWEFSSASVRNRKIGIS